MTMSYLSNDELHEVRCSTMQEQSLRERARLADDPAFYYNESPNKGPPTKVSKSPSVSWLQDKPKPPSDAQLLMFADKRIQVLQEELAEVRTQLEQVKP